MERNRRILVSLYSSSTFTFVLISICCYMDLTLVHFERVNDSGYISDSFSAAGGPPRILLQLRDVLIASLQIRSVFPDSNTISALLYTSYQLVPYVTGTGRYRHRSMVVEAYPEPI